MFVIVHSAKLTDRHRKNNVSCNILPVFLDRTQTQSYYIEFPFFRSVNRAPKHTKSYTNFLPANKIIEIPVLIKVGLFVCTVVRSIISTITVANNNKERKSINYTIF